jgi:amino acid adenylation domain-containing protein
VLRVDLSGNPTFAQLLGRVKALTLDAYAHQDVPFEKLVEELKPQRDLSRPPLFQIEFVLHDDRDQAFELTGLAVSPIAESPAIAAKLDLSIELTPGEQGLAGVMIYNRDLFSADAMTRLGGHFTELLRSAANRPEARIAELAMLPDDERAQLVSGCNETHVDYGVAQGLHEMVEAQAARTPDAIAIVFEGEALAYDAMNRRANQLAHYLRTLGVGPESLVGICMDRSFEMVIGLLGILKAGGAYVPFDPSYPAERLSYMFEDAGCRVLLTEEHRLRDLPANAATTVCLDRDCDRLAAMPADNPVSGATADNLAYMIYTSGSTGRPKGAMNSHRGVWNRLRWMQQQYGLASDDRVLQKTPFSFDVSVWEFFWPLAVGARLVVAKPGGHQDRTYLAELIAREAITTVHFVPSMLQVFLDEPQVEQCLGLRRVICSGEALSADLQRRWYERMPVPLHNLYGPTEAAVDVTYWECVPGDTRSTVPIGRPVANTQMYVLDDHLAPVPVGVDGELYIGGVQVGRGYLNRAALTAERFIPDPFSAKGARLYRTGDIARRAADGTIEYVGRADHQVKVRGFRIELGEIESVLQEQAAVQQAVVMVREDVAGDPRLVAYVLSPAADSGLVGELRALVASRLPQYMQPSAYVILDALPLSPNGKVDRRALPAPDGRRHLEEPAAAPRNELEEQIAAVWREVLRVPDLGIYDNFFDLGGHSLLATQLTTRLQRALGVELRLTAVFQAPTVAAMADLVLEQLLMEQGTDGAELLLGEIQRLVP